MNLIYSAVAVLIGISALATFFVVGRQALRRIMTRRLIRQSEEVRSLLKGMRERNYVGIDKMLFDMRDNYDLSVIEDELHGELAADEDLSTERLRNAFDLLGLTARYIEKVRGANGWQERARSATALGQLGDPRAVEPLIAVMRDKREDSDVKLAAAEALGRIKDPSIVPQLCEQLSNIDEWASPRLAQVITAFGTDAVDALLENMDAATSLNARVWSAQVLGKIKDRRATPALIQRLHDRSEQMRVSVASALGDIGDNRAFRPLLEVILRDPVAAVRSQVAAALGRIGDEGALPILVAALRDPDYWTRFRALEAIEALGASDTTPIEGALSDPNPEVRKRAALALERLGILDQVFEDLASADPVLEVAARMRLIAVGRAGLSERLARHLDDENVFMRERIASLLGPLGDPKHVHDLVKRLDDESEYVRFAAIESLGDLGVESTTSELVLFLENSDSMHRNEAVKALIRFPVDALSQQESRLAELLLEESDEVRFAALQVLSTLPGASVDALLKTALQDRYIEVRLAAVEKLGIRSVEDAIPEIGRYLNAPNDLMRTAAAAALGRIGGTQAIDLLLAAMPNTSGAQRDSICGTLAALGFDAVRPLLDVLMGSDDQKSRMGAIWTLGKTGDPRAVTLLRLFLLEGDTALRASAAGAIGKIPCTASIEALSGSMVDPDSFVRSASVNGLGRIGKADEIELLKKGLADPDLFVRNRSAIAIGRIGGELAHEVIVSVPSDRLEPALRVIAMGLTGSVSGIGRPLAAMKDPVLRDKVSAILQKEDEAIQVVFFSNLTPQPKLTRAGVGTTAEVFGRLEPKELLESFANAVRNSQDSETRKRAAAALAGMADDEAISALTQALARDPDASVRMSAAKGLTQHSELALARNALLLAVRDPHPEVRLVAVESAGNFASTEETTEIFLSLRARDPRLVEASETALAKIHESEVQPVHDWMMGQETPEMQVSGLRILAQIGDARSLGLISALIRAEQPQVRIQAAQALAKLQIPEAIRVMLGALADPVEEVRVGIIEALAGNRRSDVLDALAQCCLDPSVLVRRTLANSLAGVPSVKALNLLATLAEDVESTVSATALLGLLRREDREGQRRLLGLLGTVGAGAIRILRTEAKTSMGPIKEQIRSDLDAEVRELGVQILSSIDAMQFASDIAEALRDPDAKVRLCAVQALSELDPESTADWLQALLEDPVKEVRLAAKRALFRVV